MGCGFIKDSCQIHKATAVEILNEEEAKNSTEKVKLVKFTHQGELIKIHFKEINGFKKISR